MKVHGSQRRQQEVGRGRSAHAPEEDPVRLRGSPAASAAGRQAMGSVSDIARLQRVIGNAAVCRLLADRSGLGTAPVTVQRFAVDEMKQALGDELLHKHVGTEPMPDVSTSDGKEEATAAVYYQRNKDDRRSMNTVFFANPDVLFADLKKTNKDVDLKSGPDYTTTDTYPAITVLVVGRVNKDSSGNNVKGAVTGPFVKLQIQHGPAKPMVKINKESSKWAFNHLQQTDPKKLGNTEDLLESTD